MLDRFSSRRAFLSVAGLGFCWAWLAFAAVLTVDGALPSLRWAASSLSAEPGASVVSPTLTQLANQTAHLADWTETRRNVLVIIGSLVLIGTFGCGAVAFRRLATTFREIEIAGHREQQLRVQNERFDTALRMA
jgi:hypothetical protein